MPTITPGRSTGRRRRITETLTGLRVRGVLRRRRLESLISRLDRSLEHLSAEPLGRNSVEALRYFWLDGFFSSVSLNLYSGFVTLFALAYGASNAQVGQLTAVASLLAAISLFPGRTRHRPVRQTQTDHHLVLGRRGARGPAGVGMRAVCHP